MCELTFGESAKLPGFRGYHGSLGCTGSWAAWVCGSCEYKNYMDSGSKFFSHGSVGQINALVPGSEKILCVFVDWFVGPKKLRKLVDQTIWFCWCVQRILHSI